MLGRGARSNVVVESGSSTDDELWYWYEQSEDDCSSLPNSLM